MQMQTCLAFGVQSWSYHPADSEDFGKLQVARSIPCNTSNIVSSAYCPGLDLQSVVGTRFYSSQRLNLNKNTDSYIKIL